jgi:cell division protein FtsZ
VSKRRASMREGPLADLFRQTTEGAARESTQPPPQAEAPPEPPVQTPLPEPPVQAPPVQAPVPEPVAVNPPPEEPAEIAEPAAEAVPRLRAVPDPGEPGESMPPLPEALRVRGEASAYLASIRVVGVGGGGLNALQRMIDAGIHGVEFVAINTDAQQLAMSDATVKLQIGRELTSGLGSGADPDLGRKAAEDSIDRLRQVLRGSDLVFVTAGEGGGTGTGAAPVIARAARELGALTVGIVTMPFGFEGKRRSETAQAGLDTLQSSVDTLIVVPNDRLLEVLERGVSMVDAFRMADDVLRQGVQGICDLITRPGVINLDFADVRTVMAESGSALMGIGMATGPARGREAARRALDSPLIGQRIRGATGVLLSVMGPSDLTLQEVTEAAEAVREAAAGQANIIFGTSVDETLGDQLWVTVIATGFERSAGSKRAEPERSRDRSPLRELEVDDDLDVPSFLRD